MSSTPQWLKQVWDEQTLEAFFYFNAWGHLWKEQPKRPTIEQILKIPQEEWVGLSELLEEHPDGFQRAYGTIEGAKSYIGIAKLLFLPGFPTEFRKMRDRKLRDKNDAEVVFFISMWILTLFVTYLVLSPKRMGKHAMKNCLLLSHNAQYIYREFWEIAAAWNITLPNFTRTEKVNMEKRREREVLYERAMEIANARAAANTMFNKLPKIRQARFICSALKKLGINTSEKTITRFLDTRTSVLKKA